MKNCEYCLEDKNIIEEAVEMVNVYGDELDLCDECAYEAKQMLIGDAIYSNFILSC